MRIKGALLSLLMLSFTTVADNHDERDQIERAVLDYIESQHKVMPELMARGVDEALAKRTYWKTKDGSEIVLESTYQDMLKLAGSYNKAGDKFPDSPRADIEIYDIDKRVASVKLHADDWIDYMHLYKNDQGQWKVINVLWQFNETQSHSSASR